MPPGLSKHPSTLLTGGASVAGSTPRQGRRFTARVQVRAGLDQRTARAPGCYGLWRGHLYGKAPLSILIRVRLRPPLTFFRKHRERSSCANSSKSKSRSALGFRDRRSCHRVQEWTGGGDDLSQTGNPGNKGLGVTGQRTPGSRGAIAVRPVARAGRRSGCSPFYTASEDKPVDSRRKLLFQIGDIGMHTSSASGIGWSRRTAQPYMAVGLGRSRQCGADHDLQSAAPRRIGIHRLFPPAAGGDLLRRGRRRREPGIARSVLPVPAS